MTEKLTPAQRYQGLIEQEKNLISDLARYWMEIENTKTALGVIRAAIEGAELGFQIAQASHADAVEADVKGGECQT